MVSAHSLDFEALRKGALAHLFEEEISLGKYLSVYSHDSFIDVLHKYCTKMVLLNAIAGVKTSIMMHHEKVIRYFLEGVSVF